MNLQQRIDLSVQLGDYILSDNDEWNTVREQASRQNPWFTPDFISLAAQAIGKQYLDRPLLEQWTQQYKVPSENTHPKNVGIVMAGNLPLVGFHDMLCAFIAGHRQTIKASTKDDVLIKHLVQKLIEWEPSVASVITFADNLKNCDAYIATGSNNTARYFDYYFGRYPGIIRRNRTSVALLDGHETMEMLQQLADDVHLYFGLGCRNVTKIYVPGEYDFVPMLEAFKQYHYLADHHKYKNNYDYNLAIHLLNKDFYMTNGSIILHENKSLFSPISQLNFEYYSDISAVETQLAQLDDVQCITGHGHVPFGKAQQPGLADYADGTDTLQFLLEL